MDKLKETGLSIFSNEEFGQLRWIMRGDDPWFVANDVAKALGYANPREAVIDHCKYAELLKGSESLSFTDSPRGINIIPEADVYALVFRSKLPKAEKFRDWVFREVLPQIRKTGKYQMTPKNFAEALRAYADEVEKREQAEIAARQSESRAVAAEECLGIAAQWQQVKAMDWVCSIFDTHGKSNQVWSRLGKLAKSLSLDNGYPIRQALDCEWGQVGVYHVDILKLVHMYVLNNPDFMSKYRKKHD